MPEDGQIGEVIDGGERAIPHGGAQQECRCEWEEQRNDRLSEAVAFFGRKDAWRKGLLLFRVSRASVVARLSMSRTFTRVSQTLKNTVSSAP